MNRGDIWWAELEEPIGKRPVAIVSRVFAVQRRSAVIVAVITPVIRQLPVEVLVGKDEGLSNPSVVNCDGLYTVPKELLKKQLGCLTKEKMARVNQALCFSLGLDE